jgi:hypothetical protein
MVTTLTTMMKLVTTLIPRRITKVVEVNNIEES